MISKDRNPHLDAARAIAALAVLMGHTRSFYFEDYKHLASPGIAAKVFYFITGYGHQAVMVFFVLSGYLVGGAVCRSVAEKRWSWSRYGTDRLTRLWMVLIPALAMTWIWDGLGRHAGGGVGYAGAFANRIHSGPIPTQPAVDNWSAWFRNLFFLQTITGPVFGSNGPLWSLANEFWYYVLFPLALPLVLPGARPRQRLIALLGLGAAWTWLPNGLLLYGLIWAFGVAAYLYTKAFNGPERSHRTLFTISTASFVALLTLARIHPNDAWLDFPLGLAFAGMLPFLVRHAATGPAAYKRLAAGGSELSYSLYLTHFAPLACLFYAFTPPGQAAFGPQPLLTYVGLCAAALLYAALFWWAFESRTQRLKGWLRHLLIHA